MSPRRNRRRKTRGYRPTPGLLVDRAAQDVDDNTMTERLRLQREEAIDKARVQGGDDAHGR